MTSAEIIRAARAAAGLTQVQVANLVAEELGLSPAAFQPSLTRYESGAKSPSGRRLAAILRACGVDQEGLCRAAVGRVLPPAVLAQLCVEHGGARVASVLRGLAWLASRPT